MRPGWPPISGRHEVPGTGRSRHDGRVLLANAVAVLHAAVVLFMLTGALLALRWPRLVLVHVPVALAVLAVNLSGAPCPITTVELALRERAGAPPYAGGFLGHVVFG